MTVRWTSTRDTKQSVLISQAIGQGLAANGGLFVPTQWPQFKPDVELAKLSFPDFAARILEPFFAGDSLQEKLLPICKQAFDFPLPLKVVSPHCHVLELFHGPTSAFKDFGARFLALCMSDIPASKNRYVLVATSGDTGGAVAAAFSSCTKIPVCILYPKNKISERQEVQLTSWGSQVKAFAVKGTFDDCQRMAKQAFNSKTMQERFQLISANSINVARLLPQMAYFAYTSLQFYQQHRQAVHFIVPSGNLGNGAAALWAKQIGFPIRQVVFAHNENATVPHYFQTGQWNPQASLETLANAMDVGDPSNFERIRFLYPDLEQLKNAAQAFSVGDATIRQTIKKGFAQGHVWCPHTATAAYVYEILQKDRPNEHFILVATADPAKFEKIVEPLIGQTLDVPEALKKLMQRPSVHQDIEADLDQLESQFK